jgi:hypothetical protein
MYFISCEYCFRESRHRFSWFSYSTYFSHKRGERFGAEFCISVMCEVHDGLPSVAVSKCVVLIMFPGTSSSSERNQYKL